MTPDFSFMVTDRPSSDDFPAFRQQGHDGIVHIASDERIEQIRQHKAESGRRRTLRIQACRLGRHRPRQHCLGGRSLGGGSRCVHGRDAGTAQALSVSSVTASAALVNIRSSACVSSCRFSCKALCVSVPGVSGLSVFVLHGHLSATDSPFLAPDVRNPGCLRHGTGFRSPDVSGNARSMLQCGRGDRCRTGGSARCQR